MKIICYNMPCNINNFEFLQSQEAGVLKSISLTILLKLNIVDLIGLLYL